MKDGNAILKDMSSNVLAGKSNIVRYTLIILSEAIKTPIVQRLLAANTSNSMNQYSLMKVRDQIENINDGMKACRNGNISCS
jgi:hypothetical protein